MSSFVQVIGTGAPDAPASVLLFLDKKRYLFNVGDGTQRLCIEQKSRLGKLSGVFLSQITPDTIGGLFGMMLTLAETKRKTLMLTGPKGMCSLFDVAKPFYRQSVMDVQLVEVEEGQSNIFTDEDGNTIEGIAVQIRESGTKRKQSRGSEDDGVHEHTKRSRSPPETSAARGNQELNDPKLDDTKATATMSETLMTEDKVKLHSYAVSFVCSLPTVMGKFDAKKADELGVPKGPLRGKLCRGESIVSPATGETIKPEDVIAPSTEGPVVLILEVPTECEAEELVDKLLEKDRQRQLANTAVVVYLCPPELVRSSAITRLRNVLSPDVQHITFPHLPPFRHEKGTSTKTTHTLQGPTWEHLTAAWPAMYRSSTEASLKLSYIDFFSFPPPFSSDQEEVIEQFAEGEPSPTTYTPTTSYERPTRQELVRSGDVLLALPGLRFDLIPLRKKGLNLESLFPPLSTSTVMEENKSILAAAEKLLEPNHASVFESHRKEQEQAMKHRHTREEDWEVVFLGTGGAMPSKYRNVSAIAVTLPSHVSMLLDAGEGTLGQIYRAFGPRTASFLVNLKMIWISHQHADHHLGVVRILYYRRRVLQEMGLDSETPIILCGPKTIVPFLAQCGYHTAFRYEFIDNWMLSSPFSASSQRIQQLLGATVRSVPVDHCRDAFGVVIDFKAHSGKAQRIVYSGDTRPCQNLVKEGQGATLLIHEANFSDDLREEAKAKRHSTTSEALVVAKEMNAEYVALTHFSQRYPKVPDIEVDKIGEHGLLYCFAFDLQKITPSLFPLLRTELKALQALFPEDEPEEQQDP